MTRRVTFTPRVWAVVRLLASVALCLLVVGLVVHTQALPSPEAPIPGEGLEPVATGQQALAVPADDAGDFYLHQDRRIAFHRNQDAPGARVRLAVARDTTAATLHALVPSATVEWPGNPGAAGDNAFTDIGAALTAVYYSAVAWGDYDNDGDLDLALTGLTAGFAYISKVYRNDGSGVFTDIVAGLVNVDFGSVAWGDYDNDGDLDLLLAGFTGSTTVTQVYRNDGSGVFTDINAGLPGLSSGAAAWGDYDNDGDLDILLAGSPMRVYRNDGSGVFTNIGASLGGVSSASAAWGDYDNDGDLDILVAGYTGSANITKVYRNDGSGVFTDIEAVLTGVQNGSVAWGDYDNDGDLDILVAGDTGSVRVSKVYRNDGGGAFTNIGAGLTGIYWGSVAWGDYDNDGDLDIVLSGLADSGYVTKVYRNDGAGTFTETTQTLAQVGFGRAAWGDYDNDGRLDLLLTGIGSGDASKVYRNTVSTANTVPSAPTGLGAVVAGSQATLSWSASTDSQTAAAGLSYNLRVGTTTGGIQKVPPMASAASGYRRVVQGGNAGQRTTAVVKGLAGGTYYWSVQGIDGAFAGSAFATEGTFAVCGYTIDPTSVNVVAGGGSGSVTLTTFAGCAWTAVSNDAWITVDSGASGTGSGSVGYTVAANAGPARSGTITIGGQTFTVNQASGCTYGIDPTSASYGSLGGSGSVSVAAGAACGWTAVSNNAWITVNSGASGTGNGSVGYTVAANTGPARSGTITIGGQTFTVNQAARLFSDVGAGLDGVSSGSVAWGDYDNDGDLDILLTGDTGSAFISKVYRNDGSGVFTDISAALTGVYHSAAAWGDYDNDGDLDILLAGDTGSGKVAKVYRNDGSGVFTDIVAGLPGVDYCCVAWGDYDNDGDLDILLGGSTDPVRIVKVYRNDGSGVFTDIEAPLYGMDNCSAAWGDYDNDGDLDILIAGWFSGSPFTLVYRYDSGSTFTEVGVDAGLARISHGTVAWGDYDSDGDLDILVAGNTQTGRASYVYRNDGGGVFTDINAGLFALSFGTGAWADYDNDGDLDILLSGYDGVATPYLKVYRNDGSNTFTDTRENLTGLTLSSVAWGDYDNDGRLDILVAGTTGSTRYSRVLRSAASAANTAPGAPTGLNAVVGSGQVTLNWTASTDGQTPAAGLSYNVRVGTTSGGGEKVSPMASAASGYRRVVRLGNAGQRTTAVVKGLAGGAYYWSVQVIDGAFAGSAFATQGTFSLCTYAIDPTSASAAAGGGSGSVTVTTAAGCGWTAVSNDAWITVDSGASGTGSGSVGYSVAANGGIARSGTITIGGQTFTVNQAAAGSGPPTFTDDPLTAHSTVVKAVHFTELRAAIATLRARYGLGVYSWTDTTLTAGTTQVRAVHLIELRAALAEVYTAAGQTPPTYSDATITAGATTVTTTHIAEIRAAVVAIW